MKHIFYSTFVYSAFVVGIFTLSLDTTEAYNTTDQKTFGLDKNSALFLIDYKFGHKNHEIGMPFKTMNADSNATDTLAFSILDKDNKRIEGKTSSIILSKTSLKEGMYSIQPGHLNMFTLIVVFTPSASSTPDYRLQVTHLPFNFDGKQQLELNPTELQYYTTPYTDL